MNRRAKRRAPRARRAPRLTIHQHHPTRPRCAPPAQPVDIHARAHCPTRLIGRVPHRRMNARRPIPIDQRRNPLPQHIENLQAHPPGRGKLIGNDRRGVERIGIILSQRKPLGPPQAAQGRQPQRKMPGPIGCRLRHRPALQRRQIKDQHLRLRCRLARRKTHLPFNQRFGPHRHRQQQPNEKSDDEWHENSPCWMARLMYCPLRHAPAPSPIPSAKIGVEERSATNRRLL